MNESVYRQTCRPSNANTCQRCGEAFARCLTGRPKRFCSDACRDSARRDRKVVQRFKNGARYPYSGEPRNDAKSACGTSTFSPENRGRGSVDKTLWRSIVELEVFAGRDWSEVVSTDGVACQVATLRSRALRNGGERS